MMMILVNNTENNYHKSMTAVMLSRELPGSVTQCMYGLGILAIQ